MSGNRSAAKRKAEEEVGEDAATAAISASASAAAPEDSSAKRKRTDNGQPPVIPEPQHHYAILPTSHDAYHEFNHFLFKIIAFKAERGNYQVQKEDFPDLHQWLQTLKREYKNYSIDPATSSLSQEQLKVLEFLHIPVTSRGDDHWNRFYELLRQYGERHKHVLVPRLCEVPGLGDWVTDQRRQYKAWKQGQSTQLTEERRNKLEAVGFAWSVRNRPEWEQRYHELLQYKEKHGDCKVPQHYKPNKSLGKWVAKQREQYKLYRKNQHSFLTPYRLEKLNQADFIWQVRSSVGAEDELNPLDVKMEPPTPGQPMEMAPGVPQHDDPVAMPDPTAVDAEAPNPQQQQQDDMAVPGNAEASV